MERLYDDFLLLRNLPIMVKTIQNSSYDFPFRNWFPCTSVIQGVNQPLLLRIGAIADYDKVCDKLAEMALWPLVSPEEHRRASKLSGWYPLLSGCTPFSKIYPKLPPLELVRKDFFFPFFVKGDRQTSRHSRKLCIIENESMYLQLQQLWETDTILHWQEVAIREYVPLKAVDTSSFPDMVPLSYEFRLFFWRRQLVGWGPYWTIGKHYRLDAADREAAFTLGQHAADRVNVPFLAVDLAKTEKGEWIVIEVNDGQESGYAGVDVRRMWESILEIEK